MMEGMASVATAPNLRELAERVRPVALRSEQEGLPVVPWLRELLPQGLTRGGVVAVGAAPGVAGATTLSLAVAAGPSQAGAWVALVGDVPWGLVAADEMGVAFERLVVVAPPEPPAAGWGQVVAALIEGFPVVVLGEQARLRNGDTRRLAARLRERGGVLVRLGGDGRLGPAQIRLVVCGSTWEGSTPADDTSDPARTGHLHSRRLTIEASGRGAASRTRRAEVRLPTPGESSHVGR
jgi:hypothetical protein